MNGRFGSIIPVKPNGQNVFSSRKCCRLLKKLKISKQVYVIQDVPFIFDHARRLQKVVAKQQGLKTASNKYF
jgi:hypothetical protein